MECWSKTQAFHIFYETVETTHKVHSSKDSITNYSNKLPKQFDENTFNLPIVQEQDVESIPELVENHTFIACDIISSLPDNDLKSTERDRLVIGAFSVEELFLCQL